MKSFFKKPCPDIIADHVDFGTKRDIRVWKALFPKLPGPRALRLSIGAVNIKALPWILSFVKLEELWVDDKEWKNIRKPIPLTRLHGLSPTLKSLRFVRHHSSLSEIFNLICSFPDLEDLHLDVQVPFEGDFFNLQTASLLSPKFSGSLVLEVAMGGRIGPIVNKLLSLQRGLSFSSIKVVCPVVADNSIRKLVSSCSRTLKSLHVEYAGDPIISLESPCELDLSCASGLKDAEFRWNRPEIKWITRTLESAAFTPSFQKVTICANPNFVLSAPVGEWHDLDSLLVRLQKRVTIAISCSNKLKTHASILLPTLTRDRFVEVSYAEDHPFCNHLAVCELASWVLKKRQSQLESKTISP